MKALARCEFEGPTGETKVRGCDNMALYNFYVGTVKRDAKLPDGIGVGDIKTYNTETVARSCEDVAKATRLPAPERRARGAWPSWKSRGSRPRTATARSCSASRSSVERGEVVALLGRNGAGKTTTLSSVMGLVPPRAGSVASTGGRSAARSVRGVPRRAGLRRRGLPAVSRA